MDEFSRRFKSDDYRIFGTSSEFPVVVVVVMHEDARRPHGMHSTDREARWYALNRRFAGKIVILVILLAGSGLAMGWIVEVFS